MNHGDGHSQMMNLIDLFALLTGHTGEPEDDNGTSKQLVTATYTFQSTVIHRVHGEVGKKLNAGLCKICQTR